VSLSLGEGELLGLLGPNGAGKTTLIRAIAGRVRLDGGTISLYGHTLEPERPRPDLGVVPQENALYPLLTARENLETFGQLNGLDGKRLRERVAWALEWSGLAERARSPVRTFSGGMKRRLNLACGVLHEPKLVLLDEPTVGVDPQSRESIYDMLGALRARGTSLLLTTHYLEERKPAASASWSWTTAARSPPARSSSWWSRRSSPAAACACRWIARPNACRRGSRKGRTPARSPRPSTTWDASCRGSWRACRPRPGGA
jgi:ABC-type Na+ transport system ATPase subunit NatA